MHTSAPAHPALLRSHDVTITTHLFRRVMESALILLHCCEYNADYQHCGRPPSQRAHEKMTQDHYHGHAGAYFQNTLGHQSLPTASSSTDNIIKPFSCQRSKESAYGRLTSSFWAKASRPAPVSRKRATAVSPAGPQSDDCTWHVAPWKACVRNNLRPHGCGDLWLQWPEAAVVESLWLQWPVAAGCGNLT